MEQIP